MKTWALILAGALILMYMVALALVDVFKPIVSALGGQ